MPGKKLAELNAQLEAETLRLKETLTETRDLASRLDKAKDGLRKEQHQTLLLGERLHALVEVARAGSFLWHEPSGSFSCDEGVARLYGIERAAEMDHTHLVSRLVVEDRVAMQSHWDRCLADAIPFELEVRAADVAQRPRWIAVTGRPYVAEGSGERSIVGACADASATHDLAEARQVTDTIAQLVWIARADGTLEYVNDRWLDYTGRAPPSLDGPPLVDAFTPDDRPRFQERWLSTVREGRALEIEARMIAREGDVRWFLVRAVPMAGASGVIHRWTGTCTDIDALKRVERELAIDRDTRDKAIVTLGHELRTPLATIGMNVELVRNRTTGAEHECSTIERQVSRLTHMIDDTLDVSRAAAGRIALHRRPTDVSQVLVDAFHMCGAQFREQSHSVVTAIDPDLVVDGEPERLLQVFVNLLSNAAKYTPPHGHIAIRAERRKAGIQVEISDDGIGIATELQPRLFEPWVQGRSSSNRSGGLGLGLSIARSLVELHGGTIVVASDGPGRGSRFTVTLPARAGRTKRR